MSISPFKLEELKSRAKTSKKKKTPDKFRKLTLISGNSSQGASDSNDERTNNRQTRPSEAVNNREKIFNDGFAKGEESALMATKEICDLFKNAVDDAKNKAEEIRISAIDFAVKLSGKIAEKIISHEISSNSEYIFESIKKSIDTLPKSENIKLLINPSDFERFKACHPVVEEILGELKEKLIVEPSKKIQAGGYIIHTESHCINASIEKQIEMITSTIIDEISRDNGK